VGSYNALGMRGNISGFRTSTRVKLVVFGAVLSDAAMLDAVLELDVWGKERLEGWRRG
jgi:hypothetical protein